MRSQARSAGFERALEQLVEWVELEALGIVVFTKPLDDLLGLIRIVLLAVMQDIERARATVCSPRVFRWTGSRPIENPELRLAYLSIAERLHNDVVPPVIAEVMQSMARGTPAATFAGSLGSRWRGADPPPSSCARGWPRW
jgi:hypothetical protein